MSLKYRSGHVLSRDFVGGDIIISSEAVLTGADGDEFCVSLEFLSFSYMARWNRSMDQLQQDVDFEG